MSLWWSLCTLYLHMCQVRVILGDSGLCCICVTPFKTLMNSLVCWFCRSALGLILFQVYKQQPLKLGKQLPPTWCHLPLCIFLTGCVQDFSVQNSSLSNKLSTDCWLTISRLKNSVFEIALNSGAVWKWRWPSWAPVPNKPTVSVDVKQHFNLKLQPLWMLSKMIAFIPEIAD